MGLPDGRKTFKIGLAVWTQYRRVTSSQTSLDSKDLAYAWRRAGKKIIGNSCMVEAFRNTMPLQLAQFFVQLLQSSRHLCCLYCIVLTLYVGNWLLSVINTNHCHCNINSVLFLLDCILKACGSVEGPSPMALGAIGPLTNFSCLLWWVIVPILVPYLCDSWCVCVCTQTHRQTTFYVAFFCKTVCATIT